jgi:hemoglobin
MMSDETETDRPSLYEYAGGRHAFLALASALHDRCLADPVLEHPFSHTGDPKHIEHLADYLGEALGGPPVYSEQLGGHSNMLSLHASTGADDDFGPRFVACFDLAVADAALPENVDFRNALHEYMVYATTEVAAVSPIGSVVEPALALPRWSWDGPVS